MVGTKELAAAVGRLKHASQNRDAAPSDLRDPDINGHSSFNERQFQHWAAVGKEVKRCCL